MFACLMTMESTNALFGVRALQSRQTMNIVGQDFHVLKFLPISLQTEAWFFVGLPVLIMCLIIIISIVILCAVKPLQEKKINIFDDKYVQISVHYLLASFSRYYQMGIQFSRQNLHSLPEGKYKIPKHLAVIMDGNRRFGKAKYGLSVRGHADGSRTLVSFIEWCMEFGVEILTVYAFSSENWNRPQDEIDTLLGLFDQFMQDIIPQALEKDIRIRVHVTNSEKLPHHVIAAIQETEKTTAQCQRLQLNICASYGAREELVSAFKQIGEKIESGYMCAADINEAVISNHLLTRDIPDPDVLLRTSGEHRISNFLLYQIAYTELIFADKLWPEFKKQDFIAFLREYSQRQRRFGK
uniref:Alkyl transferase n=1 Tax=Albugo laibachii Nc14 TaxID=890382 RepID=F0WRK7_9STRA|nr:undecaprenyl pyrophosphate synthetase putative [Albugo laibachii Nc14]|eukprot:CCA23970.1 undecaprenyl pyrophosphate synthetase putative [Albugo laibachii Nc14]